MEWFGFLLALFTLIRKWNQGGFFIVVQTGTKRERGANDGVDATQKLQTITPDIILTDIEMPRMDGFEFAMQVRETPKLKSVPIIMISSRTAQKHRTVADDIGINAFLGKPVQDEELMQYVHDLLSISTEKSIGKTQAVITN